MKKLARVLTIAGSDSGGGAGIQADLKTFQAFDVYGMSVITSVTAQNTQEVHSIQNISPGVIADQIDMVISDIGVDAVKIGMLSNADIIRVVAKKITEHRLKHVVLDPVMVAKSGDFLLQKGDEEYLIKELLPLVEVLTPNIPEAEIISNHKIEKMEDMKEAARKINKLGVNGVLIKGGHLPGREITDLLYYNKEFYTYRTRRVETRNTHGTGCTLSSAIAASLANGYNLQEAVDRARDYVYKAINNAPDNIGQGHGPLYHNVNPPYISHFQKSALDFEEWFKKNKNVFDSELKALEEMVTDPEHCLSVGVGNGMFAEKLGIRYGVEPAEGMVALARKRGIEVKQGYSEDLPYPDEAFNQVLLGTVLSYVNDKDKTIKESYRVLKPGGEIIVSILPAEGSYAILYSLSYLKGRFDPEIAPEYPYPLEFIRDAEWISTGRLIKLLEENGFGNLRFVQTLTRHPKYTTRDVEEPQTGYEKGDFLVVKGVKM
jgi:hydroxymethylpyrimidine/phosphomethylpyrimidine kinase